MPSSETWHAIRAARHRAHLVFDQLWDGPDAIMSRDAAYRWLANFLRVETDAAHFAQLDPERCGAVTAAARDLMRGASALRFRARDRRLLRESARAAMLSRGQPKFHNGRRR